MQTQAVEDYLKTIFETGGERGAVAPTVLAEGLGVTPASVTGMIKKLADMRLVDYERYQGLVLTAAGRKIALEVIRHHRLLEVYLAEALGVPWDRVHEEADKWEHILSEDLEDRMDALLGFPTTDPHGAPIPSRSGDIAMPAHRRLVDLVPGQTATLMEVSDHDPALLRHLGEVGLYPETSIQVLAHLAGEMTVSVGETHYIVSDDNAAHMFVRDVREEPMRKKT